MSKHITVGLDIGTSKICALVASPNLEDQTLQVLGIGIAESEGLNRGVVVNIERTVNAIKKVIAQAEQQSGIKVNEVVIGIAGDHVESIQTRGIIGISNPTGEITENDVKRLLDETKKIAIPSDRKIIHVIPQDFVIDGQDGITDPIGMSGVRLEANVNIITGLNTAIQNLYRCVERCGLRVKELVLEPIASSSAALTNEEKEVGVALIDIGGGTTDIAIFEENILRYTSVFGLAGKHVTDDIRKVLGIIATHAERIKREYGHTHLNSIMNDEVFMIPGVGGRKPMEARKSYLCQIIQARMEELFKFAAAEIRNSGYAHRLGAGIVITGGTTLLQGTDKLASEIFGMPVKIGIPTHISYSGLAPEVGSPIYSTAVGLALYGMRDVDSLEIVQDPKSDSFNITREIDLNNSQEDKTSDIKDENDFYEESEYFGDEFIVNEAKDEIQNIKNVTKVEEKKKSSILDGIFGKKSDKAKEEKPVDEKPKEPKKKMSDKIKEILEEL